MQAFAIDTRSVMFLSVSYKWYDGCTEGLPCSSGMFCGNQSTEACRNCTFDECVNHAQKMSSFAFSFTSTSRKFCRLCDKDDFDKRTQYRGWGLYVRGSYHYNL